MFTRRLLIIIFVPSLLIAAIYAALPRLVVLGHVDVESIWLLAIAAPATLIAAAGFVSAAYAHCGRRACALVGASVFFAGLVLPFVLLSLILSRRGVATRDSIAGHDLVTVVVVCTLLASVLGFAGGALGLRSKARRAQP
jgi:hypothetical protein